MNDFPEYGYCKKYKFEEKWYGTCNFTLLFNFMTLLWLFTATCISFGLYKNLQSTSEYLTSLVFRIQECIPKVEWSVFKPWFDFWTRNWIVVYSLKCLIYCGLHSEPEIKWHIPFQNWRWFCLVFTCLLYLDAHCT
jgi:hypothetical protein